MLGELPSRGTAPLDLRDHADTGRAWHSAEPVERRRGGCRARFDVGQRSALLTRRNIGAYADEDLLEHIWAVAHEAASPVIAVRPDAS